MENNFKTLCKTGIVATCIIAQAASIVSIQNSKLGLKNGERIIKKQELAMDIFKERQEAADEKMERKNGIIDRLFEKQVLEYGPNPKVSEIIIDDLSTDLKHAQEKTDLIKTEEVTKRIKKIDSLERASSSEFLPISKKSKLKETLVNSKNKSTGYSK